MARAMMWGALCLMLGTTSAAGDNGLPWSGDLPEPGETLVLEGRANEIGGGWQMRLPDASPARSVEITARDMTSANHHWQTSDLPDDLDDALLRLRVRGEGRDITRLLFVRPDLHFYIDEDLERGLDQWDAFTAATAHNFALQIVGLDDRIEAWIDGRYLTYVTRDEAGDSIEIAAQGAGELLTVAARETRETPHHLPLDIGHTRSQDGAELANLTLTSDGETALEALDLQPVALDRHVDVGLARWLRQAQDSSSFYQPYYRRSAWDNLAETIMFSVPRRPYLYAHVLCVLRDDGEREPEMTLRLARYRQRWDGSGANQGDTSVRIDPDQPMGVRDLREVGTVEMTVDGESRSRPVYLARIPLDTGELADVFQMGDRDRDDPTDYFYLELTRRLGIRGTTNNGVHEWKPIGPPSGVVVLGMTLEKPGIELMVESPEPGFVFYRDDEPALNLAADNGYHDARSVSMSADVVDYDGASHTLSETFELPQGESSHAIDLGGFEYGWYEAHFELTDDAGEELWRQRVTFALLPEDTRQATYDESPYGIWWFSGTHYTEPDPDIALPLVRKMGVRRVRPSQDAGPEPYREHGVLPGMFGYQRRAADRESVVEAAEAYFEKFPEVRWAMIFHETGGIGTGIDLPAELLGEEPEPRSDDEQERFEELWERAEMYAEAIRSVDPDVKIMIGNGTTNFNITWIREQFPRELWDAVGMEPAVQKFHPESPPTGYNLQSYWIADQMRQMYGYDDLMITDCYEVDYRPTAPGALSRRTQADWYARDVLIRLAYGSPLIYTGLLEDVNSAYYTSRWGSTGVMERAPLMMPKPSYVSLATLTLVLDRAEYQRWIDTGSTVTHLLEFQNDDGYVYALWASEGERPVTLSYENGAEAVTIVQSTGQRDEQAAADSVTAGTAPRYVISQERVTAVDLGDPVHAPAELDNPQTIDALAPDGWSIIDQPVDEFEQWCAYTPLVQAEAELGNSGGILELTLHEQPEVPELVGRYIAIEPVDGPIAIDGEPDTLGVEVHGNGNWGRVMFELLDADGRRWISNGWGEAPNSWDMSDWQATTSVNFDGWRPITQALPLHYASGYYGPGFRDWRCVGDNSKTNQIAYPVELNRLYVIMRDRLVHVTDMVDAPSMSVQLRKLTAGDTGQAVILHGE